MSGCPIKQAMANDLLRARSENGSKTVGSLGIGQNPGTNTGSPTVAVHPATKANGTGPSNHNNTTNTASNNNNNNSGTTTTSYSDSSDTSPTSPSTSPVKTLTPSGELTPIRKISPSSSNPPILNMGGRKVSPPNPNHVTFYTVAGDHDTQPSTTPSSSSKQLTLEDTGSEPSNYGSGEGSPRLRKTSNISTTSSLGSEGDFGSETSGERRVDVTTLIEGVGTLIIPAVS
ncbi:soluble guanylate cyclase subunit [Plakobranchus ocellatus]|uniref:Soluble guanylate cyclase subunit n=1 Tax=Plakobranchus ocellatus TaxID=259542 RepID=A0AAV3XY35_9GAST|nr:soluble guanylate cyclase subunit [Plakobranchus ocellatus]